MSEDHVYRFGLKAKDKKVRSGDNMHMFFFVTSTDTIIQNVRYRCPLSIFQITLYVSHRQSK